jgi:uncharacterized membrane protein
MDGLVSLGRYLFAASIGAFGIQHFLYAHSTPTPGLVDIPPYTAHAPLSAYLIGGCLVIAGLCLAIGWNAALAAQLLGGGLILDFVIVHAPRIMADLHSGNTRTRGLETLVMGCTAMVLAAGLSDRTDSRGRLLNIGVTAHAGRFVIAISLAIFGAQHFMYLRFIASLIPGWMPAHVSLAAFTGAAFAAAALSFALDKGIRIAGMLLAAMFLLWVAVLHGPRVAHALHNGNEWASLLVALAMSGTGLLVAGVFGQEH